MSNDKPATPASGNGNNRMMNMLLGLLLPPLIGGGIAWCRNTNARLQEHGTDIAVIKASLGQIAVDISRCERKLDRAIKQ
jgi:hypothetical protein